MTELSELITFYRLPAGRAAFALTQVSALAREQGALPLADAAEEGVRQALLVRDLELARRTPVLAQHGPQAIPLNQSEDRLLGVIKACLDAHVEAGDPELQPLAAALLQTLFPKGLAALTTLPFVEQQATVARLMVPLTDPLAPSVEKLGLTPVIKRLGELNEAFGAELHQAPPTSGPTNAQVLEAKNALHLKVLEVIARTLGNWPTAAGADVRTQVLAPLMAQSAALAEHYRTHHNTDPDINPTA